MSNLDPTAPSQPSMQTGIDQSRNPTSKSSQEQANAQDGSLHGGKPIDHREEHDVPSQHGGAATASSLGYGDTGPLKEKNISASDAHPYSKQGDLEGEQMRAPGEGDVAEAVRSGGGGGHAGMPSMTQNIDSKMKDHAAELHRRGERTGAEIEEEEHEDWTGKKADVAEALGGRGNAVVLAPEERLNSGGKVRSDDTLNLV